jgi:hypothetical protein
MFQVDVSKRYLGSIFEVKKEKKISPIFLAM